MIPRKTTLTLVAVAVIAGWALPSTPAHAACNTTPNTIDCFAPYSHKLTRSQKKRLDLFANIIAHKLHRKKGVVITVTGYGITGYGGKTLAVATKRAAQAIYYLAAKLKAMGYPQSRSLIFAPSTTLIPKPTDKSKNKYTRKVTVSVMGWELNPRKKWVCPTAHLLPALEAMTPLGSAGQKFSVNCLRQILLKRLNCQSQGIDDGYMIGYGTNDRLFDRYTKGKVQPRGRTAPCAGKTGSSLARCMNTIDKEIVYIINAAKKQVNRLSIEVYSNSQVRRHGACVLGRSFLNLLKRPGQTVYRCYAPSILNSFGMCAKED